MSNSSLYFGWGSCCSSCDRGNAKSTPSLRPKPGVRQQTGAELGQAQVKLDDIVVSVVKAMVEVEVQLLFRVGGWSDKTKLILISTLVEVEVELGKNEVNRKTKC